MQNDHINMFRMYFTHFTTTKHHLRHIFHYSQHQLYRLTH